MKSNEYILDVYTPGSAEEVWVHLESAQPFMAIHAGDLINPGFWEGSQVPYKVLRAVNVEQMVWETADTIKHIVNVYTRVMDGSTRTRLERPHLTSTDRWMLSNQLRILQALYPDEAKAFEEQRAVLEDGYELEYPAASRARSASTTRPSPPPSARRSWTSLACSARYRGPITDWRTSRASRKY